MKLIKKKKKSLNWFNLAKNKRNLRFKDDIKTNNQVKNQWRA